MAHQSGDSNPKEQPCRTCVDFKSWSKIQKKNLGTASVSTSATVIPTQQESLLNNIKRPSGCPLDKDELGRNTWALLHTMAAYYPDKPTPEDKRNVSTFFSVLSKTYPCEVCASDMQDEMKKSPPITTSQAELSKWLCDFHNVVNVKLGKSIFDCTKVNLRWRDGWLDGSCD